MVELQNIGEVPLSPQSREKLHAGESITVTFHTPRMLQAKLGIRNGAFEVREVDGELVTADTAQLKRYHELQAEIRRLKDA